MNRAIDMHAVGMVCANTGYWKLIRTGKAVSNQYIRNSVFGVNGCGYSVICCTMNRPQTRDMSNVRVILTPYI